MTKRTTSAVRAGGAHSARRSKVFSTDSIVDSMANGEPVFCSQTPGALDTIRYRKHCTCVLFYARGISYKTPTKVLHPAHVPFLLPFYSSLFPFSSSSYHLPLYFGYHRREYRHTPPQLTSHLRVYALVLYAWQNALVWTQHIHGLGRPSLLSVNVRLFVSLSEPVIPRP